MVSTCYATIDFTGTNVSAWTQLMLKDPSGTSISSNTLPYDVNELDVSCSADQAIQLGIGAASAQVQALLIPINMVGALKVLLNAGQKVWVNVLSGTANSGQLTIAFNKGRRG